MRIKQLAFSIFVFIASFSVFAEEAKVTQSPLPTVYQTRKIEPYEIPAGAFVPLLLYTSNEVTPTAQVSYNVYDQFRNVVIPRGSVLVGRYVGKKGDRHMIDWVELQLPSKAGIRLDPPWQVIMPDGSAGIDKLVAAKEMAAFVTQGAIIRP